MRGIIVDGKLQRDAKNGKKVRTVYPEFDKETEKLGKALYEDRGDEIVRTFKVIKVTSRRIADAGKTAKKIASLDGFIPNCNHLLLPDKSVQVINFFTKLRNDIREIRNNPEGFDLDYALEQLAPVVDAIAANYDLNDIRDFSGLQIKKEI